MTARLCPTASTITDTQLDRLHDRLHAKDRFIRRLYDAWRSARRRARQRTTERDQARDIAVRLENDNAATEALGRLWHERYEHEASENNRLRCRVADAKAERDQHAALLTEAADWIHDGPLRDRICTALAGPAQPPAAARVDTTEGSDR